MEITLKGDMVIENVPSLKQKALRINLNENIYGSFAEIGAGQETVRQFFRAGGASRTIAKSGSRDQSTRSKGGPRSTSDRF